MTSIELSYFGRLYDLVTDAEKAMPAEEWYAFLDSMETLRANLLMSRLGANAFLAREKKKSDEAMERVLATTSSTQDDS